MISRRSFLIVGACAAYPGGMYANEDKVTAQPIRRHASIEWKEGQHFRKLDPSVVTRGGSGELEILEFFWYGCPHCYRLESRLDAWEGTKPADVRLTRVPVVWKAKRVAHARLYYTLQSIGRDNLHDRVFTTIHEEANPQNKNKLDTLQLQLEFARANGVDVDLFQRTYNSSLIDSLVQAADALSRKYAIDRVPTLVINHKYVTDPGQAGGEEALMNLLRDLVKEERATARR